MSNLRPAPLFLTPQVTRDILGVGHARNMAEIEVVSLSDFGNKCSDLRLNILREIGALSTAYPAIKLLMKRLRLNRKALQEHLTALRLCGCIKDGRALALTAKGASKIVGGGGKAMPSIGFIAVHRDGALSAMMTTQEFIKDDTPRAGFWRVRAKVKPEIAGVLSTSPQQSRDGELSSCFPLAVPAIPVQVEAKSQTPPSPKPAANKARVAAAAPVTSKTAGAAANIERPKFRSWVEDYLKPEEKINPELVRIAMNRRGRTHLNGQSKNTKGYHTTVANIAEAQAREKHRREDPFELAKSFLQKRGPVFSATFRDGPKGEWFVAGQRGFLTGAQVIELAKRNGWAG